MSETNQKLSFLTRRDQYLKLPRIHNFLVPLIVVMALIGLMTYLFLGQLTITYTGLSYEINDCAYLLVPYPYQQIISPEAGATVWIGNDKGTVERLNTAEYITYDSIKDNNYFMVENNPYFQKDMTYLLATASFKKQLPRTGIYKVVLGTVRPIDMLFGGAQ